jgi:hypothetical protein
LTKKENALDNDLLSIRKLIISRDNFSEDIDIHIKPPVEMYVEEDPLKTKQRSSLSRRNFYDWLAASIKIDGITSVARDYAFDDKDYYRSGGIRLYYKSQAASVEGVKEGILLEAGFDTVTPNIAINISSWAYDKATLSSAIDIIDNRAINIACYHPGYTFVEKLQTIAAKFRQEQNKGEIRPNLLRQYYDVYCLLSNKMVQEFIGTPGYKIHKERRFSKTDLDIPIALNEAFLLNTPGLRAKYRKRYEDTSALYYKGQPDFDELLDRLKGYIHRL